MNKQTIKQIIENNKGGNYFEIVSELCDFVNDLSLYVNDIMSDMTENLENTYNAETVVEKMTDFETELYTLKSKMFNDMK